jgi:hypothetical protein
MPLFEKSEMKKLFFTQDESGAVTVDWVVLTAAITFMGISAAFYVSSSAPKVANNISTYMGNIEIGAN